MINTGGGVFDPTDRPIYFGAAGDKPCPQRVLVAVNELMTPAGERLLVELLDAGHTVLLDSGIFWLTNAHKRAVGCTMDEALALPPEQINDFDVLFDRYVDLVRRYGDRLWGYIELDQGGAVNKRRTRARLHDLGLAPIPVYHPLLDGWNYFDELAETHDRMCFGNIVQAQRAVRVRLLHTLWERHRAYPDLWVHVLGLTANEWCLPIPPDSCDSSTWLNPLRWRRNRLASAALKVLSDMGDPWRYDRTDRAGPNGHDAAATLYADVLGVHNTLWRVAAAEAAAILDLPAMPPYLPGEQEPQPC